MKILIVSPFENSATGRGDRNLRLVECLKSRGHEVILVTSNFDHGSKRHIPASEFGEFDWQKVISVPGYTKNVSIGRFWCHIVFSIKLWIWAFFHKWDSVVSSSIPPENLLAVKFLRKRKFVVDVRDIWPDALLAYGDMTLIKKLFSLYCHVIYRLTLGSADKILVVAPSFRRWLARYNFKVTKVKFVPLGFRRADFLPVSDGGQEYAFCYAGGITPQFDFREFKEVFGSSRGVVLGDGPLLDASREAFPESLFLGSVSRSVALEYMKKSEFLLFPSNPFACLPNKAFDYFALGRPVMLGANCSREAKYLLNLRRRKKCPGQMDNNWRKYAGFEKEQIALRAAKIIEKVSH